VPFLSYKIKIIMKKIILIICFFFCYAITTPFAQNYINTKWQYAYSDTSLLKDASNMSLDEAGSVVGEELIITRSTVLGWTIQKINIKTGQLIWQNGRNQNKPTKGKDTYLYLNTFTRADKNIEVIGIRSLVTFPFIFFDDGFVVKNVFDWKTGKELQYLYDKTKNAYLYSNVLTPLIKVNDNKYYCLDARINSTQTLMLGTLDSNLIFRDTLAFFDKGLDTTQKSLALRQASFNQVGDKLMSLSFLFGGKYDTTGFRHIFSSYDIKTKKVFEKEVSKGLLYYNENIRFCNISDGYLHTGYTDSTLSILRTTGKNPKYIGKVSKIDQEGNVLWNTFIPHPLPLSKKYYGRVVAAEDSIRKGYWVMAGSDAVDTIPMSLVFLNKEGKILKTAYVKKKPYKDGQVPFSIYSLNNGDLIGSYRYFDCTPEFDTCFKVFNFDRQQLDLLFKTDVSTITFDEDLLSVFPNPCNEKLTMNFSNNVDGRVNIIDIQGKIVQSHQIVEQNEMTIETNALNNGVYFIYFTDNKKTISCKRIIVQH
jgi:hypothetical protein